MRRLSDDDVTRLARTAERLVRLVKAIDERRSEDASLKTTQNNDYASLDQYNDNDTLAHVAREAVAAHLAQPHFGQLSIFRNPPWLLMLELFLAKVAGTPIPVTSACLSLGGAQTTALRVILELERGGVVFSSTDETDGRRRLINLSPDAEAQLRAYLARLSEGGRRMHVAVSLRTQSVACEAEPPTIAANNDDKKAPYPVRSISGTDVVLQ